MVWRSLKKQQRPEVLRARLLAVYGQWQRQGEVKNLIAHKFADIYAAAGEVGNNVAAFPVIGRTSSCICRCCKCSPRTAMDGAESIILVT